MKFCERFLIAGVCLCVAAASKPLHKYHPANFGTGSAHFAHYHAVGGAGTQIASKFGAIKTATQIPILRSDYNTDGGGNYHFGFETANGIKRDESGHFPGSWPSGSLNVAGSYSYTGDDGKLYSINYKADSQGFRAEGNHLPTPPPIPREIQETLHLHQRGGSKTRSSMASFAFPATYANGRRHQNFITPPSRLSKASTLLPNVHYLPTQQNQGYIYRRRD